MFTMNLTSPSSNALFAEFKIIWTNITLVNFKKTVFGQRHEKFLLQSIFATIIFLWSFLLCKFCKLTKIFLSLQSSAEFGKMKNRLGDILGFAELKEKQFWRAILAETLATLLYIFTDCGSGKKWDDDEIMIYPSLYRPKKGKAFFSTILWCVFWWMVNPLIEKIVASAPSVTFL